jgi:hypothetical protein
MSGTINCKLNISRLNKYIALQLYVKYNRPSLWPTQSPVQWVPGVLSPGVKARPGRDADHSPPSSADVDNV